MKLPGILASGLMLAACASVPVQKTYLPTNSPAEVWLISAHVELEARKDKIIIEVNNERAITGMLSPAKLKDSFVGSYRYQPMTADCSMTANGLVYDHQCTIYVNGKLATIIDF